MLAKHSSSSATTTSAFVDRRLYSKKRVASSSAKKRAFVSSSSSSSSSVNEDCSNDDENARRSDVIRASISRRRQLALIAATTTTVVLPLQNPSQQQQNVSFARNDGPTVLVVGSTGQTGKLVVSSLSSTNRANVVAGCRSLEKAKKLKLDQNGVELKGGVDVTDTTENLALAMDGVDVVVIATGFVPGNPFKMNAAAHEVDNEGVVNCVDAAKKAGTVKKIVLISSILTNGREAGLADTPGFKITNAFGGVLDEKLVGEKYLRNSGIDWVIVRPAGLKNDQSGSLIVGAEDAMASGEIDRHLVAEVMARAALDDSAKNKVYEIAEEGSYSNGYDCGEPKCHVVGKDSSKWFV
jgi:uncharacterized protein YbjT (DUF2867 family)